MLVESIANELTQIKNELESLEVRYNLKRNEMYNSLTNNGMETYTGEEYTFRKTDECTYLTINKENFHRAINEVLLTDEQKEQIKNIAFEINTRDSGLRITKNR